MKHTKENPYLEGALITIFAKTSIPIILIMSANGLYTLVDAYYLGKYVGEEALTAVTLMFPIYMLLVAAATLVSSGFSSVYSRLLGSNSIEKASRTLCNAVGLAAILSLAFILVYVSYRENLTLHLANDSEPLAQIGDRYMVILIMISPMTFLLSLAIDTLRCEGKLGSMVAVTLLSSFLNFLFNYLFIVTMGWGVSGSAWGTVSAQFCALLLAIKLLSSSRNIAKRPSINPKDIMADWRAFLALGIPSSLSYIGMSISAGVTLYCIQQWDTDSYAATAGAYGIITRLMTFVFLPLLGLSMAFQTIVGNNYGAKAFDRSKSSFDIAVICALFYCVSMQLLFYTFKDSIGFVFVDDVEINAEIARILPISTRMLFLFGPTLIISSYYQAIGKAGLAALLSLTRTYLFTIPLMFALTSIFGEVGIWYSAPTAEVLMLLVVVAVFTCVKNYNGTYLFTQHVAAK